VPEIRQGVKTTVTRDGSYAQEPQNEKSQKYKTQSPCGAVLKSGTIVLPGGLGLEATIPRLVGQSSNCPLFSPEALRVLYDQGMKRQKTISKYIDRVTSPKCVVFDMDATLCVHGSQMGFWDCDKFPQNKPVVELARMVKRHGYDIVIATARGDRWAIAWCKKYGVDPAALYMKNNDVESTGSAAKGDQLVDIERFWNIEFWVDDSPFNAKVIEDHGVHCVRISDNDEFWAGYGDK
jgi:hypothetical protein